MKIVVFLSSMKVILICLILMWTPYLLREFPLYHNWSYDRIYRSDMIKQPDVLMFMFLYSKNFSFESKKINYEYYEPKCIHESSLSPSIHSVFASELQKHEEAFEFFGFATRMDLDNYNRNTKEGLHTTSLAGAMGKYSLWIRWDEKWWRGA